MIDTGTLWFIIFTLGIGSFLLRFSFLGLVGDQPLPEWARRYLRYTAVAIIPALVAPIVALSNETGSGPEPIRLFAAIVTLGVGIATRNVIVAILAGACMLGFGLFLFS
ncbi:MAG: branched-subunit amino acid transport protein [Ascidiaceihabitans sp.]|jgi:branched-subunit amino acid transport protein|tara:strand:+ start:2924 stop:3250 length:327 start_codon:yes stop_codon:yes gene_type:complete